MCHARVHDKDLHAKFIIGIDLPGSFLQWQESFRRVVQRIARKLIQLCGIRGATAVLSTVSVGTVFASAAIPGLRRRWNGAGCGRVCGALRRDHRGHFRRKACAIGNS